MRDDGTAKPLVVPAAGIIFIIISTLLVVFRFVGRCSQRIGRFDCGDLFLGLSLTSAVALTVVAIYASLARNLSIHDSDIIRVGQQVTAVFFVLIVDILYMFAMSNAKLCIFWWFHDLTRRLGTRGRYLVYVLRGYLLLTGACLIAFSIVPFIGCQPFEALWSRVDPSYNEPFRCINYNVLGVVWSGFNAFTDLSACILPLLIIRGMEEKPHPKLGIAIVLMLGSSAFAIGIARIFVVRAFFYKDHGNWTWGGGLANLVSIAHIHLTIVCACLPFVYPLVQPTIGRAVHTVKSNHARKLSSNQDLGNATHPGYMSIRSRSPQEAQKSTFPMVRDSIAIQRLASWKRSKYPKDTLPKVQEPTTEVELRTNNDGEKKHGKRKVTPPNLNLSAIPPVQRAASTKTFETSSQYEITVAYTPLLPQPHVAKMMRSPPQSPSLPLQSPTIPPDLHTRSNRISTMSWLTSRSKQSTWSSIRSSLTTTTNGQRSPRGAKFRDANPPPSPTAPVNTAAVPYSPGLSTIDLGELPDIHALPTMSTARSSNARLFCTTCGKFHPLGYRHSDGESLTKLALWRSSRSNVTGRQSQSTFYNEEDEDEDKEDSVQARLAAARARVAALTKA